MTLVAHPRDDAADDVLDRSSSETTAGGRTPAKAAGGIALLRPPAERRRRLATVAAAAARALGRAVTVGGPQVVIGSGAGAVSPCGRRRGGSSRDAGSSEVLVPRRHRLDWRRWSGRRCWRTPRRADRSSPRAHRRSRRLGRRRRRRQGRIQLVDDAVARLGGRRPIAAGGHRAPAREQFLHAADHHLRLERLDQHAVAADRSARAPRRSARTRRSAAAPECARTAGRP